MSTHPEMNADVYHDTDVLIQTVYTIPGFHELSVITYDYTEATQPQGVSIRIIPVDGGGSGLRASILGVSLLEDVTYYLQPNARTAILCCEETKIEVTGKEALVSIVANSRAQMLKMISNMLRNETFQSEQKLYELIRKGALGPFAAFHDRIVPERNFAESCYNLILSNSSCRVLVTGRGSFGIAQTLYNWAQHDGNFPTYVELDTTPQLFTESCKGPPTLIFPPGCIGIATGHSSWGFRRCHERSKTCKTVEPILIHRLADNTTQYNVESLMYSSPLGRLCYYIGSGMDQDNLFLYSHYIKLIAASLRLQQVEHLRKAFICYSLGEFSSLCEIQHLLSRLSFIVHLPERLHIISPTLFEEMIYLMNIKTVIVSDNTPLAESIRSLSETHSHKELRVLTIMPLDPFSESSPDDILAMPVRPKLQKCSREIWRSYIHGPSDFPSLNSSPRQRSIEVVCCLSCLKFFQIISTSSKKKKEKESVNGVVANPINIMSPREELEFYLLGIVISESDGISLACTPVSFFVWVQSVCQKTSDPESSWSVSLVSPTYFDTLLLKKKTTYCLLPVSTVGNAMCRVKL